MSIRLAFAGFRHGHILELYRRALATDGVEVVAACEENEAARAGLIAGGVVKLTHGSVEEMLASVACDAVAVGDTYGRRGRIAIEALRQRRHVLSDKPICTRLDELDEIEELSLEDGLRVGCMLDLRDAPAIIGLREVVQRGRIGPIHSVSFSGQHPLLLGRRPQWYFEPGQHGGTINDIAIHAFDVIPWVTGLRFTEVVAARCWNALAAEYPHFQDGAQVMLTLANGCGVLGDVSYFAPNSQGYTTPWYWRITAWGERGVAEGALAEGALSLALDGETAIRREPLPEGRPGGYLEAFLRDVAGRPTEPDLTTEDVLRAARVALVTQEAADKCRYRVALQR